MIENYKKCYNEHKEVLRMELFIGAVLLLSGAVVIMNFLGSSPSLKKRDEHNQSKPMDDSIYPSHPSGL
jgi:hypothetical protein